MNTLHLHILGFPWLHGGIAFTLRHFYPKNLENYPKMWLNIHNDGKMWGWINFFTEIFLFQWYESEAPELQRFPSRYEKLAAFSRLCLIRAWRSDRVPSAISLYINATVGHNYIAPPITVLNEVLASTSPTTPIVLIVKPGADPPAALTALAQNVDFGVNKIKYLSLGQGQEAVGFSHSLFALPIQLGRG